MTLMKQWMSYQIVACSLSITKLIQKLMRKASYGAGNGIWALT